MPAPNCKEPWADRIARVHRQFPSTASADATRDAVLRSDDEKFARNLLDLVRVPREHTRRGQRAMPDMDDAAAELRELFGIDGGYSVVSFLEEFQLLVRVRERSVRAVAAKTGINRARIHRLLTGAYEPSMWEMEQIAKAFNKSPSHFREYRALAVGAEIARVLDADPDRSAAVHRQMTRRTPA